MATLIHLSSLTHVCKKVKQPHIEVIFPICFFPSVQRFHHAAPILFTKTVCDCRLVQPRSRLRLLELAFFNQPFHSGSSARNASTQSEQKARLLGSPQSAKDEMKPGKD